MSKSSGTDHRREPGDSRLTPDRGRTGLLFLTSSFPRWEGDSATPVVLHLAEDLQNLGWDIHVLAPAAAGAAPSETIAGVPVSRFRYAWPETAQTVFYDGGALANLRSNRRDKLKLPLVVGAEIGTLLRRLSGRDYALLHSHWILPQGFAGVVAARPLRVPHVATVHGSDVFALRSRAIRPFQRLALSGSTAVTVNSSATETRVRELSRGRVSPLLIPMGANVESPDASLAATVRSRYRTGAGPLVVFVGRLVPEKGVFDLLDAFAEVARRMPDATLMIGGAGPSEGPLARAISHRGLEDRAHLIGWIDPDEVVSYMAAGDVVTVPSVPGADGTTEAFGLTAVEAMASGTPVVASRIGGLPDIIVDGETGTLVEPGSARSLAVAIERVVTADVEKTKAMAETAQRRARERFSREASAAAFSDLYSSLIAAGGGSR